MVFRTLRSIAALAAISLAGACSASTAVHESATRIVRLDHPFQLAVGQSASLDDSIAGAPFHITFLGVTNESRCPEDVMCVWEGDARVALRLQGAGSPVDTAAHTSGRFTPPPELGAFRVTVDDLLPRTRSDRAIEPSRYVVTLRVTRR